MWTCLSPSSGQYTVSQKSGSNGVKWWKRSFQMLKRWGVGGGEFIQYLIALNSSNGNARVLQLSRDQTSETFVNSALRLKVLQCCVLICCVRVCGALHAWNDSRVTASHTYVYCEKQVWMRRGCFEFRSTRSHLHGGGVERIVATYCTQTSETTGLWISYLCSVVCRCVFSVCLKVVASFVIWLWMEYSHKWSLQLPFIHPQIHFNPGLNARQ